MEKAIKIIELALAKYHQHIDSDVQIYNKDLNRVMKIFTFLTITFSPQIVIGCLFGMNVTVPWSC